jgi:hypothetical protein
MKRLWHLLIAMAVIAFFSQLRSWTAPKLTMPPSAADWKLKGSQNCSKSPDLRIWPGTKGARLACTAKYEGSPEMTLTLYDMQGWPGPTAFGAFQEWQARPGVTAFYKGGYFGVVEAPEADGKIMRRFTIAVESALPPGAEGHR